jgi:dynein heavy chain, axonemal
VCLTFLCAPVICLFFLPAQNLGGLESELLAAAGQYGLQPVDSFMAKVIQLYETINIRFGVTVVGPTGSGKSSAWKTLSTALSSYAQTHNCPSDVVETRVLNPKSIEMRVCLVLPPPLQLQFLPC